MKYLLTILYVIFTTSALFLMKMGGNSLTLTLKNSLTFKIGYLTLLGLLFYIISFILWQKLIVSFDLTYVVPITTGIVQIIILAGGVLFFKESINLTNLIGIILIIIGLEI